jgi:hypothetical protein
MIPLRFAIGDESDLLSSKETGRLQQCATISLSVIVTEFVLPVLDVDPFNPSGWDSVGFLRFNDSVVA